MTPENIERWRGQIETPYDELSEPEKEADRERADRVLRLVRSSDAPEGLEGGTESARIEGG